MKIKQFFLFFSVCLLMALPSRVSAQTVNAVKNDPTYLWGEGHGESLRTAEKQAVTNLLSQISQFIKVESETKVTNSQTGSVHSMIEHESVMKTYSTATVNNMQRLTWQEKNFDYVLCYVKKAEVDRLFKGRTEKVKELVKVGHKALASYNIADALRYYYWAYCMLQSLPYPNEVEVEDENEVNQTASVWLHDRICSVLDNLSVEVVNRSERNVCELAFLYMDKPVSAVDFIYNDGQNWVQFVNQARDGKGEADLQPGYEPDYLKIRFEYEYKQDARCDREVEMVLDVVDGLGFNRKNEKSVKMEPRTRVEKASVTKAIKSLQELYTPTDAPRPTASVELSAALKARCESAMQTIVNDIRTGKYADTVGLFTKNGHDTFDRLIHYGKARIVEVPPLEYAALAGYVYCRSIPMNFTFSNQRKFVEEVVFVFDADGKVDNVQFGLGKVATNDVFKKNGDWSADAKNILVTFLENYKTAYALERLDYLESIFSDDAVILVGNVVKRYVNDGTKEMPNYKDNKYVRLTQMSKNDYMKNLRRVFGRNEYVNIKFANNEMRRMGKGGEVYGIQIKQDYFSSSYGDSGFLFIMVDVNDPNQPIIHVRAWQEQMDPEWGLVGPEMF